eukprot:gi/632986372/ref/XP_007910200.1/ PREDICTED: potassium channel subfamily K member 13-like [Callorhinchus milii]
MADSTVGCGGSLNQDNARFLLLAGMLLLYLVGGAAVFSAIERPGELIARRAWSERLSVFAHRHNVSLSELLTLLRGYEEASKSGVKIDSTNPRWDFTGAFYFVGTVVSTIGFGMTTPVTVMGKIFLIFYGLLGCASTILFFNLVLERTVTLLALVLRWLHEGRASCRRRGGRRWVEEEGLEPRDEGLVRRGGETDNLESWKPSVYYVLLSFSLASVGVCLAAAVMYWAVEGWSFADSLYFSFVAFSTIGFGDLVSDQGEAYANRCLYRVGNFLFLLAGVCCVYSLFNVISVVIKKLLNQFLGHLSLLVERLWPRGNTIYPSPALRAPQVYLETVCGRQTHGNPEMISIKEFLASDRELLGRQQKEFMATISTSQESHHWLEELPQGLGA